MAMLRKTYEMLKSQWNSLYKSICLKHHYVKGTFGNVEKPLEYLININIVHHCVEATLGNVEKTVEVPYKNLMHRYVEGTLGNVEKPLECLIAINIDDASLC